MRATQANGLDIIWEMAASVSPALIFVAGLLSRAPLNPLPEKEIAHKNALMQDVNVIV